jgi:hypothetical protein
MIAKPMIQKINEEIENLLYPELRPYGRSDRDRLLREAAKTPLDFMEWAGILAALVFVVILTRYSVVDFGLVDRIAVAVINFLVAILLLGVTAGPFLVRQTRRGLHSQLPLST